MNKSENIAKIAAALVKAQSEMGNAVKDSKNPFFKSNFATLNAVREASLPVLNKHGIGVFQPTTVIDGKLYVETTAIHESGEFISGLYEVVTGKANDPQATGAAVSYARRYALQALVNIGADDDDAESAMGRSTKPATKAETKQIPMGTAAADLNGLLKEAVSEPAPKKGGFGVKVKVETGSEDGWA